MTDAYDMVIGLEVHAQLETKSKLFSYAPNAFGSQANSNVSELCLALPGSLPVLNQHAISLAIQAGLALDCRINERSVFARKNYYYPDLPKGYQISQFEFPLCEHGHLMIPDGESFKRIGITRIHVEEDAGKLVHQGADAIEGASHSLVDLNRAGVPLIEIVSEPDIRSIAQARAYLELLREILVHMGVCNGSMEKGNLRCDANLSLKPKGSKTLGTRTEVKNLNSFRSLERALKAEKERQAAILNEGGTIVQETRNYNDATQSTSSLRSKEDAHDYRYFSDPDLPPLIVSKETIAALKNSLPEHPVKKRERYKESLQLGDHDIKVLLGDKQLDRFFNSCLELKSAELPAKKLSNWIVGELSAQLKQFEETLLFKTCSPESFILILEALQQGRITQAVAKELLAELLNTGTSPKAALDAAQQAVISDDTQIRDMIEHILNADASAKERLASSDEKVRTKVSNFIVGQVMKQSKGKAKPNTVKDLLAQYYVS